MEEINQKDREINIKELEGEPADLNLAEVQEVEGQFEKRVIHAPDEYSLDISTVQAILEGFTEGALQNIIALSADKIRLYKVTLESIDLLSCSDIPAQYSKSFISGGRMRKGLGCSVQVFNCSANFDKSFILKFDFDSGALLACKELSFKNYIRKGST